MNIGEGKEKEREKQSLNCKEQTDGYQTGVMGGEIGDGD